MLVQRVYKYSYLGICQMYIPSQRKCKSIDHHNFHTMSENLISFTNHNKTYWTFTISWRVLCGSMVVFRVVSYEESYYYYTMTKVTTLCPNIKNTFFCFKIEYLTTWHANRYISMNDYNKNSHNKEIFLWNWFDL